MTSTKDIQTPLAKGASLYKKDASTEKTPASITMAPTTKHPSSLIRKRSSAAGSDGEGTDNESFNKPIKRTRIEGENKTPTAHKPPSRGQSVSSRGLTRPEEHVFDIPGGAIIFGKAANKKELEGVPSIVTPSKKLIDVNTPAQVVKKKVFKFPSAAEALSRTSSIPALDTEEDDEEQVLSPPSTSPARLTSLNETMRRIYNVKPDDTDSLVLCRDVSEIMNIKNYNFAVMGKKLAKLEKDAEAKLSAADVTNRVTYKELLEKVKAFRKKDSIGEEKVLPGDPADNRTIGHLQRQTKELEQIHKYHLNAYEDLARKYSRKCQAHNDTCEELKDLIQSRERKIEAEFQRGCNVMEKHYRQENQNLRSELRNYQLENQHLQSELTQGREWAKSVVNSCPHPVQGLIEAENARDCAFAESDEVVQTQNKTVQSRLVELQQIEQEKARILEEHNEYLRGRTVAAGSEDDSVSYVKTDSVEKGRHDGMYNHHSNSRKDNDSNNDDGPLRPAVPAAGLPAKSQTRKSIGQLQAYQPVDNKSSKDTHSGISSIQSRGDFRTMFKCPHDRGSRGKNCIDCGEQIFFEDDKEFVSKQPSFTPQKEDNFDDLPDYESDEPVSTPPEQRNRGARSYAEVGVQPHAAIPDSVAEDDTSPSPEKECSHPIMFENKCGACSESMKNFSNVSHQVAPIAKNKVAGTSARRYQSLAKKPACQHVLLDKYGVCEACFKCQHLKVNHDNGNCQFCWANVNPPVSGHGVAASPDSSPSSPPSRKTRNHPNVDSETRYDSKAWSRPIKKVKTVTKNSLDIMFPTLPAFQPAPANPFASLADTLPSGKSKSSTASFFKAAHSGWKTPAVLSSPVSLPALAASSAPQ